MFYVYILFSEPYDKFYVGHTEDFILRLEQHNNSEHVTYTSKYRPWSVAACFEGGETRAEVMRLEILIKKMKSKKMLKRIIDGKLPDFLTGLKRVQ